MNAKERAQAYLQKQVRTFEATDVISDLITEIERLEEEGEIDRGHGRDFIRLWKEGKSKIAELEQELENTKFDRDKYIDMWSRLCEIDAAKERELSDINLTLSNKKG